MSEVKLRSIDKLSKVSTLVSLKSIKIHVRCEKTHKIRFAVFPSFSFTLHGWKMITLIKFLSILLVGYLAYDTINFAFVSNKSPTQLEVRPETKVTEIKIEGNYGEAYRRTFPNRFFKLLGMCDNRTWYDDAALSRCILPSRVIFFDAPEKRSWSYEREMDECPSKNAYKTFSVGKFVFRLPSFLVILDVPDVTLDDETYLGVTFFLFVTGIAGLVVMYYSKVTGKYENQQGDAGPLALRRMPEEVNIKYKSRRLESNHWTKIVSYTRNTRNSSVILLWFFIHYKLFRNVNSVWRCMSYVKSMPILNNTATHTALHWYKIRMHEDCAKLSLL